MGVGSKKDDIVATTPAGNVEVDSAAVNPGVRVIALRRNSLANQELNGYNMGVQMSFIDVVTDGPNERDKMFEKSHWAFPTEPLLQEPGTGLYLAAAEPLRILDLFGYLFPFTLHHVEGYWVAFATDKDARQFREDVRAALQEWFMVELKKPWKVEESPYVDILDGLLNWAAPFHYDMMFRQAVNRVLHGSGEPYYYKDDARCAEKIKEFGWVTHF